MSVGPAGAAVASPEHDGLAAADAASPWRQFVRRFRRDRLAVAAVVFLVLLVLAAAVGGPLAARWTGHGVTQQFERGLTLDGIPLPPLHREVLADGRSDPHGQFFLLGTDRLGRDMLVRLLYGARVSLAVAFSATAGAILLGVPLGLLAGYYGRLPDLVVSRAIDLAVAFPSLLFAVGLAAVIGAGFLNVIVVIVLFSWYYPARIVRNAVRSLREQQFVEAALSIGASDRRIVLRHLLPQLTAPIVVYATGVIAQNILFEAGLSYLGLGVRPPTPSWGQMLSDGVSGGLYRIQPWTAVVPGLALVATTLAFNQFGDAVRDALGVE